MTAGVCCEESLAGALRAEGLDTVAGAFAYGGGQDLAKPNLRRRQRTRLSLRDGRGRIHELYLKRYGRESLLARLCRRMTYGRRRSPAGVEFQNIRAARAAGLPTMREVIYGEQMGLSGAERSYVIVTAVPGDALERCFEDFLRRHGADEAVGRFGEKLAELLRGLHGSGYVHRDLYSSHIFLHESGNELDLYLIDLARMFAPRWRKGRWRIKDLAQLKYSMPGKWVERYWNIFLSAYLGGFGAHLLQRYGRAVDRKVAAMRRRSLKKHRPASEGNSAI